MTASQRSGAAPADTLHGGAPDADALHGGVPGSATRTRYLLLGPPEWRHGLPVPGHCLLAPCALPRLQVGENTCDLRLDQRFGPADLYHVDAAGTVTARPRAVDVRLTDLGAVTVTARTAADPVPELRPLAPLFLLGPDGEVYSTTVETETRVVFLRCGDAPGALTPQGRLADLAAVTRAHRPHAQELNNHNNSHPTLRKWHPEEEIEQKFDLPVGADIWTVTHTLLGAARRGDLPGFVPHLRLPYTRWEFDNHLFEFGADGHPEGYVSFIPEAGRHIVKEKRFRHDQLRRFERVHVHIDIGAGYEEYLATHHPQRHFRRHPTFRRLRYDIDVESLDTGNHYVISVDRCQVHGTEHALAQCEVEYVDTRSVRAPRRVMAEHERLVTAVESRLHALSDGVRRSFRSKLTFLRSLPPGPAATGTGATGGRATGAATPAATTGGTATPAATASGTATPASATVTGAPHDR